MTERKRKTAARKPVRRTRKKKSGGGRFLFSLLFFIAAAAAAIYFTSQAPADEEIPVAQAPRSAVEQVLDTVRETAEEAAAPVKRIIGKDIPGTVKEKVKEETSGGTGQTAAEPAKKRTEAAPAASSGERLSGRLAVVIDDGGRDLASQRVYESLGIPLTLAVMPNQPSTSQAAAEWAAAGLPVIIHQPMESVSGAAAEPVFLSTEMTADQQAAILQDSFSQIPQAVGMNNHQGSKATIHRTTMNNVMKALAARGMFFLDSATNSTTAADAAASAYGVPYVRNELFVDNSTDVEEIKAMIRKGARMAASGGSAVIIGHCRPHTAEAFRQIVPELQAEGITFVYASSLTH